MMLTQMRSGIKVGCIGGAGKGKYLSAGPSGGGGHGGRGGNGYRSTQEDHHH